MRSKLIWAGREPAVAPPPPPGDAPDVDVLFDPETGFGKSAPGVVSLSAAVLPSSFDGGQVAPHQLRALAFAGDLDPDVTPEQLAQLSPVSAGTAPVVRPGLVQVDVPGLEPGAAYSFALVADFAS